MPRFVDISGPVAAAAEVKEAINADFYVHVGDYGAVGDGVTDDTTAIQDAIDAAETAGGGVVHFPSGRFLVSDTLILPSGVQLEGTGTHTTDIYLADNSNCVVIQTAGFDELTGTNTALVSEGVPYGFGLSKIKIDGNKANNATAPVAVQWFGKGFTLFDVFIVNGKGGGLYTESAFDGYQPVGSDTTGKDAPEAVVYQLSIKGCHGHGWEHRGPHDMRADQMFIQGCKNPAESPAHEDLCRALYLRSETDVYNASGDFGFAHIYDSDIGFEAADGVNFRFAVLISETSKYEGVILNSVGAQFGTLKAYKNWRSETFGATDASVVIGGLNISVGTAQIRCDYGGNGLYLSGANCQITAGVDGANGAGTGVVIDGSRNQLDLMVVDFDDTGGVGVEFCPTAAKNHNMIHLSVGNCDTGFVETTTGGVRNTIIGSCNGNVTDDVSATLTGNNVMVWATDDTGIMRLPGFTFGPTPAVDNDISNGSSSLRWQRVHAAQSFDLRTTSGETYPRKRLGSSGLEFGAGGASALDCRIDRSAADRVRCYDQFVAASLGVGNSAAATTLGSVTAKIEVFDESGSSLGFIPVYGSIS